MPAAPEPVSKPAVETVADDPPPDLGRAPARHTGAMRLARLYELLPLTCPSCGVERRIIAFITEAVDGRAILEPIGEPATPPRMASARGPPQGYVDCAMDAIDAEAGLSSDPLAQPEYEYDRRVSWWRPAEGLPDRPLPLVRKPHPPLPLPTAKTVSNTPRQTGCGGPITLLCSAGA